MKVNLDLMAIPEEENEKEDNEAVRLGTLEVNARRDLANELVTVIDEHLDENDSNIVAL